MIPQAASVLYKIAGAAIATALIAVGMATASPPVQSVEQVDPERYAGTWFEVARLPNSLQSRCVADATTTYRPLMDGSMRVIQRCRDQDSRWFVTTGRAVATGGDPSGARLKLSYLPAWLDWLPSAKGDHWVVMLDGDYRYAVVSEPNREHLWILSRTPEIDAATYEQIVMRLRMARFPVDQLIQTPQRALLQPPVMSHQRTNLMV